MKVLSVRQPWAHLIVSGIKAIENRSWTTAYRGPLLIHAGQNWADVPVEVIEEQFGISIPRQLSVGGIIGVADVVGVITKSDDAFFTGPFGWQLENARHLSFVRCPGRQRLFDPPATVIAA
jgi:hypothetical protein